jgi:hypothetical protein
LPPLGLLAIGGPLTARLIRILGEFPPREPRFQLFGQLARDHQVRIVEHPSEACEGIAEWGENRADQDICIEDDPLNSRRQ